MIKIAVEFTHNPEGGHWEPWEGECESFEIKDNCVVIANPSTDSLDAKLVVIPFSHVLRFWQINE